jgi:hypothetical protein
MDHENADLQPAKPNENGMPTIEHFDSPVASASVPRNETGHVQRPHLNQFSKNSIRDPQL